MNLNFIPTKHWNLIDRIMDGIYKQQHLQYPQSWYKIYNEKFDIIYYQKNFLIIDKRFNVRRIYHDLEMALSKI